MPINEDITIDVSHIVKDFRIYKDKSHTFKDRVLFRKRNAYELNHVINDISFQCRRGQAIGLIGHNGCGKSTTLKLLNKILYPDSGTITMRGKISSLIELGAGFHQDMTGRENIYINASIFGLRKHEIDERLDKIIRFSELEKFIDSPVRTYSSGMYMRLAFSIAINVDADILLVDEILAVGDANFQAKCFSKLAEIKAKGTTIVIVSHSMDQIKSICDRVLWIDNGKIREDGPASKVCDHYLFAMNKAAEDRRIEEAREEGRKVLENPNHLYPFHKNAEQASNMSDRSGNMQIRCEDVRLEDMNGSLCQQFHYGDMMRLYWKISENPEKKNCFCKFEICTSENRPCTEFDSLKDCDKYFQDDHACYEISIQKLLLGSGSYYLNLILLDEKREVLDKVQHAVEFQVMVTEPLSDGLIPLKAVWDCQEDA